MKANHPANCLVCSIHPPVARIERWQLLHDNYGVHGKVYGDKRGRWADGEDITTSRVKYIDDLHCRTENSNYILGVKQCLQP